MKKIILALLILSIFSCSKTNVKPKLDPNKRYYMKYETPDQVVKMRVSNDTLRLDFYENVIVLVDAADYGNSWAMHLEQDFSNSYLKGLDFDAIASAAGYAHNWVPINLNDAAPGQKTSTDVTVDGKQYVKVTITRKFEFYNKLGTNQAAVNQQNSLLQTTNHTVAFKAYYSDGAGYSLSNDATSKIIYQKN